MPTELTDDERTMLAIESKWYRYAGIKESDVREQLDISMTVYYQLLAHLVFTERAIAADPITCRRLRDRIAQNQRSRSVRRSA